MLKNILIFGGNRFVGKSLSLKLSKYSNVDVFNRSGTSADNITTTRVSLYDIPIKTHTMMTNKILIMSVYV